MRFDIRLPLGLLFLVLGLLLTVFGLASNKAIYERSLGINVNFWWGGAMLLFGLLLSVLGRQRHRDLTQAQSNAKVASESE
jgi:hypothetical protein